MADKNSDKHPYTSSAVAVAQIIAQLRKSFPPQVTADTLKKLGIAPNNESYVINLLRFLQIIDADGNKNSHAAQIFSQHSDDDFHPAFADLVSEGYKDLFALHGDAAWTLVTDKLISYFRSADHTSGIVGKRQATTFQTLAIIAGKADGQAPKSTSTKTKKTETAKATKASTPKKKAVVAEAAQEPAGERSQVKLNGSGADVGLTVRIEINLPPGGDKDTYDAIFKSIRENLLNGTSV